MRRQPDEDGLAHWTERIYAQRLGLRELWNGFIDSNECQDLSRSLSASGVAAGERFWCMNADGFRIYLDRRDSLVSAGIAARGYEPHVTATLRLLLNPGAVFLDLGANVGYFTLLAASLVGAQGRVLAFEPRPDNVALLTLSLHENRFANVTVHPLAVAENEQEFKVYPSETSSLSHVVEAGRAVATPQWSYTVRAVALDAYLADLPRLDVIKVDIDGNEIRAFRGMRELIRKHQPAIVFEFAPPLLAEISQETPEILLEEVMGHGYDIFVLGQGKDYQRGPQDIPGILNAYARSNSTHVDLVAYPKRNADAGVAV